MKTWTIRRRILGSFAAVLALMIVMGAVAYACLARVAQDATALQKDSLPGMAYSGQLMAAWLDNFALTQKHVLETEDAEMRKVETQLQANRATWTSCPGATRPPSTRPRTERISTLSWAFALPTCARRRMS